MDENTFFFCWNFREKTDERNAVEAKLGAESLTKGYKINEKCPENLERIIRQSIKILNKFMQYLLKCSCRYKRNTVG